MLKKIALAAFTITIFGSAAIAAEYYVVREKTTQKCKVVETRPTETTWVQVGPLAFKTRDRPTLNEQGAITLRPLGLDRMGMSVGPTDGMPPTKVS